MKTRFFLSKSIATVLATTITLTAVSKALPKGEQVQAGTAVFNRGASALNITTSDRAIINYSSFNIGAGERVTFIQPSAMSVTLNRVTEANPSRIFGTLQANGQIVLANPYGIFFESGSVINVGGLVAAAGHISDSDFLAGRMNFSSLTGDVENRGNIIAIDDVALYGVHVSNEGTISSQNGSVAMVAGGSVYVGEKDGNIFAGTAPAAARTGASSKPAVSNSGSVKAPKVMLAAGDMYGMAVAHSGTITSDDITISGGQGGRVEISGKLDASNRTPGKRGGKVKVLGENVALRGAKIDASGAAGGGEVLVGGDYQGTGTVKRAKTTSVDAASTIAADALTNGNGGKVIVWSDVDTTFAGAISARGGSQGGDGGFAEVSGKLTLGFNGTVDLSAAAGRTGSLLLDPSDISIQNLGPDDTSPSGGNPNTITGNSSTSILTVATLQAALGAANVIVDATAGPGSGTGTITVVDPVTWATANTLRLDGTTITINGSITSTGGGGITMNGGGGAINIQAPIAMTGGGDLTLGATNAITSTAPGTINIGAGVFTAISKTADINLSAAAVTAGTFNFTTPANVTVNNAGNNIAVTATAPSSGAVVNIRSNSSPDVGVGGITATGAVTLTSTGLDIILNGPISAGGNVSLTAARNIVQNAGGIIVAPAVEAIAQTGFVDITAETNGVGTLAGSANGDFRWLNNPTLSIGLVGTSNGISSTTGDIAIATRASGTGRILVDAPVNATAGDVTLLALAFDGPDDIFINQPVTAAGLISLGSFNDSVVEQTATGTVTAPFLAVVAGTYIDLTQTGNAAGASGFAAAVGSNRAVGTGFLAFTNSTSVLIDTVSTVAGITVPNGGVYLSLTNGNLSQTPAGIITTPYQLGVQTTGGSVNLGQANLVTGAMAVQQAAGNVTLRNTGNVFLDTITSPTVAGTLPATFNGITAATGAGAFVSLISDTGTISQNATGANRIVGGELRLATTNQDAILTNTANQLTGVGAVTLGAGGLLLVDSTGGLNVVGPVTANGGVFISTNGGNMSVNGPITAGPAIIQLRDFDSAIVLNGVLTGATVDLAALTGISQPGGRIAADLLIAIASGDIIMNQAANTVTDLTGSSRAGRFSYRDANAINVAGSDSTNGVTALNDITIVGGAGGAAGGISISAPVSTQTGTVRLQDFVGNITQTDYISGQNLMANAAGSVSLGAVTNFIQNSLAGRAGGSFRYLNSSNLTVSSIAADAITTGASGVISRGDIAIQVGGGLTLNQPVNAANGAALSSAASGNVRLRALDGNISQNASGSIIGNGLLLNATGVISLTAAGLNNDVQKLAAQVGLPTFTYFDRNDVSVASVSGDGAGLGPTLPIAGLTGITGFGGLLPSVTLLAGGLLNVAVPLDVQTLSATALNINLANTTTVGDLIATTHLGTGFDGLIRLTGSTYRSTTGNIGLNPSDRSFASRDSTILSEAGNLLISAPAGNFTMGNEQKLLADNGRLTIDVGQTATLGDVAAFDGLVVNATNVLFQGRAASNFTNQGRQDQGLNVVAPTIDFSSVGSVGFTPGTLATNRLVFMSTASQPPTGAALAGASGITYQVDPNQSLQFHQPGASGSLVQPIAGGPVAVQAGDTQVQVTMVNLPKLINLPEDLYLDNATKEVLRRMGIEPRESYSGENITISLRRGTFAQPVEGKAEMENLDYKVVLNRLTQAELRRIVDEYLKVAGPNFEHISEMAVALSNQVAKFRVGHPDVMDLTGFAEWLSAGRSVDKEAEQLCQQIDQLSAVFSTLAKVGLTKKEILICKMRAAEDLKANLPDIETGDILLLIDGKSKEPAPVPAPGAMPPPDATEPSSAPLPPPPPEAAANEPAKDAGAASTAPAATPPPPTNN